MSTLDGTLYERLLAVRKHVKAVGKDARNEQQRFAYTSSDAVLGSVRDKLNELGLLLIPAITGYSTEPRGDKQVLTHLPMTYTWVCADDPTQRLEVLWYAQGCDMGEKGVGKALTYGEKFFIKKFFQIPTSESDPDAGDNKPQDARPSDNGGRLTPPSGKGSELLPEQKDRLWSIGRELWPDLKSKDKGKELWAQMRGVFQGLGLPGDSRTWDFGQGQKAIAEMERQLAEQRALDNAGDMTF